MLHSSVLLFQILRLSIDLLLDSSIAYIINRDFRLIIIVTQACLLLYLRKIVTYIPQVSRVIVFLLLPQLYLG